MSGVSYKKGEIIESKNVDLFESFIKSNPAIFEPLEDEKEIEELGGYIAYKSSKENEGIVDAIGKSSVKINEIIKTINALVREVEKIKEGK